DLRQARRVLHPVATTDENGTARFTALPPGRAIARFASTYKLHANQDTVFTTHGARGETIGVTLIADRQRPIELRALPQPIFPQFRLTRHDGRAFSGNESYRIENSLGTVDSSSSSSATYSPLGETDLLFLYINDAGLYKIGFDYAEPPSGTRPIRGPHFVAEGVFAASAILATENRTFRPLKARAVDDDDDGWTTHRWFGQVKPSESALFERVVHTDEETPAWGAQVWIYTAADDTAAMVAHIDAAGRAIARAGYETTLLQHGPAATGRSLVVLSPGRSGSTVLPMHRPIEGGTLVLPKTVDIGGQLTIGGKPPADWPGQPLVVARPVLDGDVLSNLLTVATTPRSDGSFTLSGLMPGLDYVVQASLDDLWLTESQRISADTPPERIDLAMAEPGGAVRVTVLDEHGDPAVGKEIDLYRPRGPLEERYWSLDFVTDGDGVALIPTLEVGEHYVGVSRGPTTRPVVPPIGQVVEVELRVRPSRR
ncbi:MAG: hypothetical protein AAGK78_06030, partial [Planctomycetota bacterium]